MKERYKNMNSTSQTNNNPSISSQISTNSNSSPSINISNNNNNNNNNNDSLENQNFLSPYNSNNFMAPPIGGIVRCTMCLGNTVQGKVLAYDQQTKMLALKTSVNGKQNLWDVSLINVAWCGNLDVIEEPNEAPEILPSLNIQNRRTKMNIETKNKEISALGNDVPTVAQNLYFTILKTLNEVEWEGKNIVIMKSVVIEPPYEVNNCRSKGEIAQALEHVKKFHEDYKNLQQPDTKSQTINEDKTTNQDNSTNLPFVSSSTPPLSYSSVLSAKNEK